MKIIVNESALKAIIAEEWGAGNFDWGNSARQLSPAMNTASTANALRNFMSNAENTFRNNVKPDNYVEKIPGDMSNAIAGPAGVTPEMLNQLSLFENSKRFGYQMGPKDLNGFDNKDAGGHLTYGYGLLRHPSNGQYMDQIKRTWSQKELEQLYMQSVKKMSDAVKNWANSLNVKLNQYQIDAMTSACYNFGSSFLKKNICKMIANNPNNQKIHSVWSNLSNKQGRRYPGLVDRRKKEADWYFQRA